MFRSQRSAQSRRRRGVNKSKNSVFGLVLLELVGVLGLSLILLLTRNPVVQATPIQASQAIAGHSICACGR